MPPEIHRALLTPQRIERTAQRLAMLEQVTAQQTRTTLKAERTIVGSSDRWVQITKTSPSGKTLFVCRSCGTVSPAPNKTCPGHVTNWQGAMVLCADWEPGSLLPRSLGDIPGLQRAVHLLKKQIENWPPFDAGRSFGRTLLKELEEELKR